MKIEDFAYNSATFGAVANLITLLTITTTHSTSLNTPAYIILPLNLLISASLALDPSRFFCNIKNLWEVRFEKRFHATGTTIYLLMLAMILLDTPPLPVRIIVAASSIPVATALTARLIYINELTRGE